MKKKGTLLIVDDNHNILTTVKMLLEDTFQNIFMLANPNAIPATLREKHPDVVLLDMNFRSGINTGNEGLYWLREIKKLQPDTQVVLFTAYADIELKATYTDKKGVEVVETDNFTAEAPPTDLSRQASESDVLGRERNDATTPYHG